VKPRPIPIDEERSYLMRSVRQHGTRPELRVREATTYLGYRYRCNVKDLPGKPDLANKSRQFAILVHGCYWHRHAGCPKASTPSHNKEFWLNKFVENTERDRFNEAALSAKGFRVVVIWECETRDPERLRKLLSKKLQRLK
jgi:DNA mismatch endonuclease (patch repair protein)